MSAAIDLRHFRYFVAVATFLNFRRAAQELHIAQPPLSRQIRLLEEQLGVALFTRGTTGVALTAAGAALLPEAERTLRQAEKAIAAARGVRAPAKAALVIGYTTVFDRGIFPPFAEQLRAKMPGLRLAEQGRHSIALVKDIRAGRMDGAFIGLHTEAQGLASIVLHEEPFVAALPQAHRLARKRSVSFQDLQQERLFWFERRLNPGVYDYCKARFERAGFRPRILPEPPDHHILLGMIAEGRGVGLISQSLTRLRHRGVAFRPLRAADDLRMGIAFVYDEENGSPALRELVALVRAARR